MSERKAEMFGYARGKVEEDQRADGGNGHGAPPILSKADFISGFKPPDWLIDGVLQRRFIYALTGQTGHGKTAIAQHIAQLVSSRSAAKLAGHDVDNGRVAYLVGENPEDLRMRVIGADTLRREPDRPEEDQIVFIPGTFNIPDMRSMLAAEAEKLGGFDLVIVDTSAAFFLGDEELSNTQMGEHARMLRTLTTLPGGPCGLVLCHPTKHASEPSQLIPRGGGAFLAEIDGNLTAFRRDDTLVELHYTKMRGPGFEPISFRVEKIITTKLMDTKGRVIPTVRAVPISEGEEEEQSRATREDENRLLLAMRENADRSLADLARACGWKLSGGDPHKSKVTRVINSLGRKLVQQERGGRYQLTDKGIKTADKLAERQDQDRDQDRRDQDRDC